MPNKNGVITRRDIIEDEALFFGDTYAKELQKAIDKNKELVTSAKDFAKLATSFRRTNNNSDYIKNTEKEIQLTQTAGNVWREQIQIENNLIATRKRRELASEGTNRALIKERIQLEENNRLLKQQIREELGLSDAYDKLQRKRNEAQRTLQNLMSAERQNINEVKRAQKEFDVLDAKLKKVDSASKNFTRTIGNYPTAFNNLGNGLKDLIGAFGVVGGVTLFAGILKNIYALTKELNSLDVALKAVSDTQENFENQQQFLSDISEKYGLEIRSLTRTYTQFYAAAKDKLGGKEIQDIFDKVSKSAALMGLSVEQQEGAFLALQQMMSKGKVQAEEIRGQLGERLPGAFSILAKSMGVTEAQLDKMLKDGQVIASKVLPKFAEELEKAYGADKIDNIETLVAEQNRLSNAWVDFVRELNEGDGVISKVFTKLLKYTAGALEGLNRLSMSRESYEKKIAADVEGNVLKQNLDYYQKMGAEQGKLQAAYDAPVYKKRLDELKAENQLLNESISLTKAALKENKFFSLGGTQEKQGLQGILAEQTKALNENQGAIAMNEGAYRAATQFIEENTEKIKENSETEEESDKERRKREKARLDYLRRLKEVEDDAYELRQFRMQSEIDLSNEIVDNEKKSMDERLDYLSNAYQVEVAKAKDTAEHKLKEFSRYNDAVRDLSDTQIQTLIEGGTIREDLFNKEKLIIEQLQTDITAIYKKEQKERDKLVAFDVAKFQKEMDAQLQLKNTSLNQDLTAENERFARLDSLERAREESVEEHERKIYGIKKYYALEALKDQVKAIEELLAKQDSLAENERVNAETRAKIENDLSNYKLQISELELEDFESKSDKKRMSAKEEADYIKQIQRDLYSALVDFSNALFERKIQAIDDEIAANEDYYQRQMELAGNDQAQKDLLESEAEKKRTELENKKRKEQHKQAVFNKALAVLETGTATGVAIMQAYAQMGPIAGSVAAGWISALGAVQLAAIIAKPIPKYAKGRKDGKEEIAMVGDGGRHEVVQHKDGSFYVTDNKPQITKLLKGDRVYSSVDEFNRLQRASIIASLNMENKKLSDFESNKILNNEYDKLLLNEMALTRKAIEKNRPIVHVHTESVDIPHKIWSSKNTNWS